MTSFSRPPEPIILAPWPTHGAAHYSGDLAAQLSPVVDAIESIQRRATVLLSLHEQAAEPVHRHRGSRAAPHPTLGQPPQPAACRDEHQPSGEPTGSHTALIITAVPTHCPPATAESMARTAARLLRTGGLLVVLTHCDHSAGQLRDPTGAIVTACQNADLLYLQHIVALHAGIRDGRLVPPPDTPTGKPLDHPADGPAQPHRRVHSDLLVFAQPHDHHQDNPPPADSPDGGEGPR